MDQFVQDQLTLIGCEQLIPLFRDNGYNEDAYRRLCERELLQLLPDENDYDGDEDLTLKILHNVESLRGGSGDYVAENAARLVWVGLFPPPNVVVKPEPLDVDVNEVAGTNRGDDEEEVQAANHAIIGAETAVAVASDTQASISSRDNRQPIILEELDIKSEAGHETADGESEEDARDQESETDEEMEMDSDGQGAGEMEEENVSAADDQVEDGGNQRKKVKYSNEQTTPKISRVLVGSTSGLRKIRTVLMQHASRNTLANANLKEHINEKVAFIFDTLEELDHVLELLERFGSLLGQVVRGVLFDYTIKNNVISARQVTRFANLSEAFFNQLTSLEFYLGFPADTDFSLVTAILEKCVNLQAFDVVRGEYLTGTETKSLRIPKMGSLASFGYGAGLILLSVTDYLEPPSIVDVETENRAVYVHLEIDFGDNTYPNLESVSVGPPIIIKFTSFGQFPKLRVLWPGHASTFGRLLTTINNAAASPSGTDEVASQNAPSLELLQLASGLTLVQEIKIAFQNITTLGLGVTTTSVLSSVIRTLSDMKIENLSMFVGYEFESALLTALRGQPFRLITENDKLKISKVKKYKYWAGFLQYLRIEFPEEELNENDNDNSNNEPSSDSDIEPPPLATATIGSFRYLRRLRIVALKRYVRLPENDLHWNNPDVKLSRQQWTSGKHRFPTLILLKELTKLRDHLKEVHLESFVVDDNARSKFERIMGFELKFHAIPNGSGNRDCFSDRDLVCGHGQQEIKQEVISGSDAYE